MEKRQQALCLTDLPEEIRLDIIVRSGACPGLLTSCKLFKESYDIIIRKYPDKLADVLIARRMCHGSPRAFVGDDSGMMDRLMVKILMISVQREDYIHKFIQRILAHLFDENWTANEDDLHLVYYQLMKWMLRHKLYDMATKFFEDKTIHKRTRLIASKSYESGLSVQLSQTWSVMLYAGIEDNDWDICNYVVSKWHEEFSRYRPRSIFLFSAASGASARIMTSLMKNVSFPAEELYVAAVYAIEKNLLENVKILIQNGMDVHYGNNMKIIAWAAHYGRLEIIKMLIKLGADFRCDNYKPLKVAASLDQNGDVVRLLIEYDKNFGIDRQHAEEKAFIIAVNKGNLSNAEALLTRVNVHAGQDQALMLAVRRGDYNMVKLLAAHGADVAARDRAALEMAKKGGHTKISRYLNSIADDACTSASSTRKRNNL